ncbi:substrate-binding domain-containing protein [Candidatus Rhodobacter oscarellae]|uniref:substrate-binding domain-containing protein n=1 Tax=Candidatus Rhodobacter oscarellae TaxID=1675527 RepID=UPI0009E4A5E7|nr:substrate-binding domain-containing protein [Candidatus Rhodobacter lobularis]
MSPHEPSLREHGFAILPPISTPPPPTHSQASAAMQQLLAAAPDTDVVMNSNDLAAIGSMFYRPENGLRAPEDVAITGFTGLAMTEALPRPLTIIYTRRHDTGRIAARRILKALSGPPVETVTDLGFDLIPGESS